MYSSKLTTLKPGYNAILYESQANQKCGSGTV